MSRRNVAGSILISPDMSAEEEAEYRARKKRQHEMFADIIDSAEEFDWETEVVQGNESEWAARYHEATEEEKRFDDPLFKNRR